MIKISDTELTRLDQDFSGLRSMVEGAERAYYPVCPRCNTADGVALVVVGVIGRTMAFVSATTRRKLIPNGDNQGRYYCGHRKSRVAAADTR